MAEYTPTGPGGPTTTPGSPQQVPEGSAVADRKYINFPSAIDFGGGDVWEEGTAYLNAWRTSTGPNSNISFQGPVDQLDPALEAGQQALVEGLVYTATNETTIVVTIPFLLANTYTVDCWYAQYNNPPINPRAFSISYAGGGADPGSQAVNIGGTNAAVATTQEVSVADQGDGYGTLVVTLTNVDNLACLCAMRVLPVGDTPPGRPTITEARAESFSEVKLTLSAAVDDVGVQSRQIYRDDGTSKVLATTLLGTQNTWIDTGLTLGTEYIYSVIDIDTALQPSAESVAVAVTTHDFFRIDSGVGNPITDSLGNLWSRDVAYTESDGNPLVLQGAIQNTQRPELFHDTRSSTQDNAFAYVLPVPQGQASRLIAYYVETNAAQVVGGRLQDLFLDGNQVETNLDVFAEVGYKAALIRDHLFTAGLETTVTVSSIDDIAEIAAIEVIPALPAPENLQSGNITETTFQVSCDAVAGANGYVWSLNGNVYSATAGPSVDVINRAPSTLYNVTVQAQEAHPAGPFLSADSATLPVTTLSSGVAPPIEPDSVEDIPTDLYLTQYGDPLDSEQTEARGREQPMSTAFVNADNWTRVSVKKGEDVLDMSSIVSWKVDLLNEDGSVSISLDSAGVDGGIMQNDALGLSAQFGKKVGIQPGSYETAYTVRDATYTTGWRVEGTAKLEVKPN